MGKDPMWISVVEFFKGNRPNIFALAQAHSQDLDPMTVAQELNDNLTALDNIKHREYPVQTIPNHADIDDAIDVFDRVNSLGTRLTEAELALAHMAGRWPLVRRIFKQKQEELAGRSFSFGLDFFVRCMTGVVTKGALYERIHKSTRSELEAGWNTLNNVLDTIVGLLRGKAHIHGTEDLSTTNVLVPIIVYLAHNGGTFKDEDEIRHFLHWMYHALLWARYSNSTDQKLERDINHVLSAADPVAALLNDIIDARGRLDLRAADLEGRGIDHPIFRLMLVAAKSQGAVDWFTGIPLAGNSSLAQGETYYIFPQHVLYASGKYTSDNHIHKKMVNEIANRIVLEKWVASAQAPDKVLPQVTQRFPTALVEQFVPSDPQLWTVDHFEDFLALRREMIANGINNYLAGLIEEKLPERVFPQIPKLSDPALAAEARRAVEKLTVDEVDIGLFLLGKLFENTLKSYMQTVAHYGSLSVGPNNYQTLSNMIAWTRSQGIIADQTALHMLRQERNDRAHGMAPSPSNRQLMFNSAGWIAGMYLDYILFFAEQRRLLTVATSV